MDQQPKIPTLKDAQKPQVKIKGMGAGVTLFDRLKQFKKKDLAFILAGLGTLFMAPLAEHFMMAPESGDASLQQGWGGGKGPGSNLFGSGSSPYENGNNNIAQGGAIGGAGDIITPLNVRDPSALVMGPGAAQQPNAGAATPPTPPVTAPPSGGEDYKDALKGAASRAASAAVKRSPLPVPKVSLGGTNLRGLGVAGGGTSASGSLGPIGPAAGSNGANGGGGGLSLVRGSPGFRGVAGARSPTGSGLDGTKKAGANAGDAFSRTGSALSGLNAAANEQIPTGGQGFGGGGGGGAGANDKPGGGSGPGGSKSVGESLAFIEAKERMMENLKLEFEKRKLKDPELLLYGIRNDILKAAGAKIGEALTKTFMCKTMITGCPDPDSELICTGGIKLAASGLTMCGGSDPAKDSPVAGCWIQDGAGYIQLNAAKQPTGQRCDATGKGKGAAANPNAVSASNAAAPGTVAGGGNPPTRSAPSGAAATALMTNLDSACDFLTQASLGLGQDMANASKPRSKSDIAGTAKAAGDVKSFSTQRAEVDAMIAEAAKVVTARNSLVGGNAKCGAKTVDVSADKNHSEAIKNLTGKDGALEGMLSSVGKTEINANGAKATAAQTSWNNAKTLIESVTNTFGKDGSSVDMSKFAASSFATQLGDTKFAQIKGQVESAKKTASEQLDKQKGLNDKLAPLVDYSAKAYTDKLPQVIAVNKSVDTGIGTPAASMAPPYELPKATLKNPKETAPADVAASGSKLQQMDKAIAAAKPDIQPATEAIAKIKKVREGEPTAEPPVPANKDFNGTEAETGPIRKAIQSVSDMQELQAAQLKAVQEGLNGLGGEAPKADTGASTGAVVAPQ